MSRPIIGLVLGGILLLVAAACGSEAAVVDSPPAEPVASGGLDVEEPQEAGAKPVVTVSLSPT